MIFFAMARGGRVWHQRDISGSPTLRGPALCHFEARGGWYNLDAGIEPLNYQRRCAACNLEASILATSPNV